MVVAREDALSRDLASKRLVVVAQGLHEVAAVHELGISASLLAWSSDLLESSRPPITIS